MLNLAGYPKKSDMISLADLCFKFARGQENYQY